MFFFQLPRLPEAWIRARNWLALRKSFGDSVPDAELEQYIEAASQPRALTSAIHYYRAVIRSAMLGKLVQPTPILAPVMIVWGKKDRYLGSELAQPDERLVPNLRLEWIPDASHWVQADAPERLNALLLDFLRDGNASGATANETSVEPKRS